MIQMLVYVTYVCVRDETQNLCCAVLSRPVMSDSVTPWTVVHQAPLSMGFSRQEYWSGLPCPPLGKEGGHIDVREKTFLERALGGLHQCLSLSKGIRL